MIDSAALASPPVAAQHPAGIPVTATAHQEHAASKNQEATETA
jgi:hypothetical protein